nr:hypothetical protein [Tanacetum cinerariifolium]
MIVVNNQKDSVSSLPLSGKKKKVKPQTVTPTLPKSQGPEASESLPQKRKKSKSKKPPTETKKTPNLKLTKVLSNPTQSPRTEVPNPDKKRKNSSEVELDPETLQLTTLVDIQAYVLSEDELAQVCNEEKVFTTRDDTEENTQADKEEHQSSSPNKDQPEPSYSSTTQESNSNSSSPDLKKFDNIHPLTERQLIKYLRKAFVEGYYEKNIAHRDQTDKHVEASMSSLEKSALASKYMGENVTHANTEEPPSHTEGEHVALEDDKSEEEPTRKVTLNESSSKHSLIDPILEILEKAKKIKLDPKTSKSAKAGDKFKKAQDAKHQVLKREHSQETKRAMELMKKSLSSPYGQHQADSDQNQSLMRKRKHMELKTEIKFPLFATGVSLGLLYQKLLEFNPGKLSSVQLLWENTDSVRSNQRMSPSAPSEPLKLKGYNRNFLEFKTSKNRYGDNRMRDSIGGLVFLVTKVRENRMSSGDVIDLTGDEDPTDEDGDTRMDDLIGVSASLGGEISSRGKKSRESNSDNTGGTTVSEEIGACSVGIVNSLVASYACMTSIYGSSYKGEKTSVTKRYLVKSFEESGEVFPGEAGK